MTNTDGSAMNGQEAREYEREALNRRIRLRDRLAGVLIDEGVAETVGECQSLADCALAAIGASIPIERRQERVAPSRWGFLLQRRGIVAEKARDDLRGTFEKAAQSASGYLGVGATGMGRAVSIGVAAAIASEAAKAKRNETEQ